MRLLTLFLILFSVKAFALVDDFTVKVPLEEGEVLKACEDAFQQALASKIEYEAKPYVNLVCANHMSGSSELSVHDYFMTQCKNATKSSVDPNKTTVTVGAAALSGAFDTAYGDIFRDKCLESAVNSYHASSSGSGAAGVRDGGSSCHAFEGCH